jgi:hypothetical protein
MHNTRSSVVLQYFSFSIPCFLLLAFCGNNSKTSKESFEKTDDQVNAIRFGSSVSECQGECWSEFVITKGKLQLFTGGPHLMKSDKLAKPIPDSVWTGLSILSRQILSKAGTTTIGCPGCADGGVCWMEIELKTGIKKRITYDGRLTPKECEPLSKKLSEIVSSCRNK